METRLSSLKFVALTVLELLAFNAQKFRESREPGHVSFSKNCKGHVRTVSGNMHVKFVPKVPSFNRFGANAQKFTVSRDPDHAPCRKIS